MATRMRDVGSSARWWLTACSVGIAVAAGLTACGKSEGDADVAGTVEPPEPVATATETPPPALNAAEAKELAEAAMLPPDSALVADYDSEVGPTSLPRGEFTPLGDCTQEEVVEPRLAAYWQTFEGPWPKIRVVAHTYGSPAVEVIGQLREIWDSECTDYKDTDGVDPYHAERIGTVDPPDSGDAAGWAADCAEVTLEDGTDGIVFCSALVAVEEYVVLDVKLTGLVGEVKQYQELLRDIASEVQAAQ